MLKYKDRISGNKGKRFCIRLTLFKERHYIFCASDDHIFDICGRKLIPNIINRSVKMIRKKFLFVYTYRLKIKIKR